MKEPQITKTPWQLLLREDRPSAIVSAASELDGPVTLATGEISSKTTPRLEASMRMMSAAPLLCEAIVASAMYRAEQDYYLIRDHSGLPQGPGLDVIDWKETYWPVYLTFKERQALIAAGYEQ